MRCFKPMVTTMSCAHPEFLRLDMPCTNLLYLFYTFAVLYNTIQYYTIPNYTIYDTILYYTTPYYTIPYCSILYCTRLYYVQEALQKFPRCSAISLTSAAYKGRLKQPAFQPSFQPSWPQDCPTQACKQHMRIHVARCR